MLRTNAYKPKLKPIIDKDENFEDIFLQDATLIENPKPEPACFSSISDFFNYIIGFFTRRK